jgi:hypothetical protein
MWDKIPLDELLFKGTGIGAIPPTRTWPERIEIKPKHYYLAEGTRIHKELEENQRVDKGERG